MGITSKKYFKGDNHDKFEQFPVRDNVDCFLSDLKFFNSKGFVRIQFTFKRYDVYLNHTIFQPKAGSKNFKENTLIFRKNIESIVSLYLKGNEMIEIYKSSTSLEDYINRVKEVMVQRKFWTKKLLLKTMFDREKGVILPRYTDYVKLVDCPYRDISYSDYENKFNRKNLYFN